MTFFMYVVGVDLAKTKMNMWSWWRMFVDTKCSWPCFMSQDITNNVTTSLTWDKSDLRKVIIVLYMWGNNLTYLITKRINHRSHKKPSAPINRRVVGAGGRCFRPWFFVTRHPFVVHIRFDAHRVVIMVIVQEMNPINNSFATKTNLLTLSPLVYGR